MVFLTEKKSPEKKGFGFGDMLGSLSQFEEYGKALVQFQADVLAALSRIEAEQARAAEESHERGSGIGLRAED